MYQITTHHPPIKQPLPLYSGAGFFFNETAQLHQQDANDFRLLTAQNLVTRQVDARCAIFVDNQLAISPKAAPFGSIEFIESLPDEALHGLIDSLEQEVQHLRLPLLRITNYPHAYATTQAERLVKLLLQRQYRVVDQMLNFHIDVSDEPLPVRMHASERRRLAKCRRHGLEVRQWIDPPVADVVRFVQQSREQQGYKLSIRPDQLAHLLTTFPDQYPVFAVWDGPTIASLAVTVRVRHDILYSFLPADNAAYRSFSPTVLLVQGLYSFCQEQGITLLDLGVSVDQNRQPKPGLIRFKRNLGAVDSRKLVLEKQFNLGPARAGIAKPATR